MSNLPMILVMQRKSIRMFPNNTKVALYYSDVLDKYFTVSDANGSILEEIDINEYHKSNQTE